MCSLNLDSYFKVGWVKEPHGLKGELYIKLLSADPEWLDEFSEFVLSMAEGSKLYSVKKWRPHKQGIIVLCPEVKNRNESELLKGCEFLIPKELLQTESDEDKPYLIELKGFRVIDKTLGEIGCVSGFVDNGAQDLLEVTSVEGNTFLIPFVDEMTVSIDREVQEIQMDLPEGLIE